MIKLENISKYYHNDGVVTLGLRKINLEFSVGEFVAITGESGSGKSTLLNVISGIDTYEDGELYINGEETSYFDNNDWENYRRDTIGFIFQNYNLIDSYTVFKNVEVALLIQGMDKKTRLKKAKEIIEKVGLTSHLNHKAAKLSGGQKQRLAIARALAKDTQIIVADEPTGNLDSETGKQILKLLNEIAKDRLVLIVTHNFEAAQEFVTRKIRLFDGEVVEDKIIRQFDKYEVKQRQTYTMSKYLKTFLVAINNLLAQPKKSFLMFLVAFATVAYIVLTYGSYLFNNNDTNYPFSYYNDYPERLIIARKDRLPMTLEDYQRISGISEVKNVIKEDLLIDVSIRTELVFNSNSYYPSGFLKMINDIQPFDMYGRFPEAADEIFISLYVNEDDIQELNRIVNLSNKKIIQVYFQFGKGYYAKNFKLVGFSVSNTVDSYILHPEQMATLYEELKISYKNYSLKFGEFEGYYSAIILDPNLQGKQLLMSKHMRQEDEFGNIQDVYLNGVKMEPIFDDTEKTFNSTIYVSQEIYDTLKDPNDYQYTANLKDYINSDAALEKLKNFGYNAFSPYHSQVFGYDAISRVVIKLLSSLIYLFSIFVIYLLSYLIIRTIMYSKKRDYTILKTIGMEQANIRHVTRFEIFTVFAISFVIFFVVFNILVITVPKVFGSLHARYSVDDYLMITLINILLAFLVTRKFNKQLMKKSIYSNLRVDGE